MALVVVLVDGVGIHDKSKHIPVTLTRSSVRRVPHLPRLLSAAAAARDNIMNFAAVAEISELCKYSKQNRY